MTKMPWEKLKYLENEKSFYDEIKNIFHHFWKAIIKANKKISFFVRRESDFKFQPNICNESYDSLRTSMNLSDPAILNIKGSNYCCIITRIRKKEAINLMQNIDLTKKSGT